MVKHFSPSQNILLNNFEVADYIVTPNTQEVFDSLIRSYIAGIRSFNLIGAYGTGKSTFLNALAYHVNEEKVFVEREDWKQFSSFEILKLVGSYDSIINSVAEIIGVSKMKPSVIVQELETRIVKANAEGRGFIFLIDEFGKFLEYASHHSAEKELYFLQQIAELINNAGHEAAFITTLHQDFSAYAVSLNTTQRNEWTKVKGRFKELTFNEPVEQLLLLASRVVDGRPEKENIGHIGQLIDIIGKSSAFPLRDYFEEEMAKKIWPLDLLSGSVLALALQQYGQNERSLFTFLNTDSFYGLDEFDAKRQNFYSVANIYDYLSYNLYSFLGSKSNIHYTKWAEIKNALERVEGEVEDKEHVLYSTLIKTIGLLNIFSHAGAKLDKDFIVAYIELTSKLSGVGQAIENLEKRNLLGYNRYSRRFFYSETTLVNIEDAINEAGQEISRANNIVGFLNGYLPLAPVSAKRAYYERGTPRVFEYKITDELYRASQPSGQVDGYINLIFSPNITAADILQESALQNQAVIYAHFLRVDDIRHCIEEIEKAEIAKAKYLSDKIIQRELGTIIDIQKSLLNYFLYEGFYDPQSVNWYYGGESIAFENSRELNSFLSDVVDEVYPLTPIFKSELANRTKLSTAISTARKALLESIINHESEEGLGIAGFPPQRAIYLSLLRETGIHRLTEEGWVLRELAEDEEDDYGFRPLFVACQAFIETTVGTKRSILEFYEHLQLAPFKLKRGFLDCWIPIYLLMKTDNFALYGQNGFIPEIDTEVLELLVKNPHQYSIKAFDTDGIKVRLFNQYRDLLSLTETDRTSNETFIKTIIPFFKFYRDLKPYVKQTKNVTRKAQLVRKVLTDATEPEKLFFEDLPSALGYDLIQLSNNPKLLQQFSIDLRDAIRELRNAYEELLSRFESIINSLWNSNNAFSDYKAQLRQRYQGALKQYLLLPYQKTFYDRLCSPLDDRAAWLSSVAQATVGKTLDQITDKEVDQLQERFLNLIHELDNLNDMAMQNINLEQEEVFKFELTAPGSAVNQRIVRLPRNADPNFRQLEAGLSGMMETENRNTKIAILAKLLKQTLENEE